MITAYLVGDEHALARLRTIPGAVNSSLARAIASLGIDLQRKIQQEEFSAQRRAAHSASPRSSFDLSIDQSASGITATVSAGVSYAGSRDSSLDRAANVRAGLQRVKMAFRRPISQGGADLRAHRRRMDLPERSFLRSVLEDMAQAIRDEVEAAVREPITR